MQIYTTLVQDELRAVAGEIQRLEHAGYDGVLTQENRHDPFLPLGVAAVNSDRLRLGTGVAIAFPRSPMVMANLGWDLQAASKGRFELGLGTQVKGHNERRFSVPWSAPVPRLKEYIGALRAIWRSWKTGAPLAFDGEHYRFTLMTPNFTPEAMPFSPPPVTMAAVGPAMLRLAGEVADGVRLHAFCTRKYFQNAVLPQLQTGLDRAGRNRASLQVSGGGFVVTGATDAEVERSIEFHRQRIAFYGSTRAYWPVLEQHDLLDVGEQLNAMARQSQWRDMPAVISDDVLQLFCAIGRHDQIATQIESRFAGLADAVSDSASYEMPGRLPAQVIEDIRAIPMAFQGFSAGA
ncbi:TIGR03617 family F420-dependent LLM class oxidoreductase [Pseudohalioglobus sediminis]|uniref:TIGR03617 family F420-dependent LLM class oxidoreductase n=1 Tax=Pseudohalioglobus sediminis TaxID=2606449 RepID=A0A5B0X1V6_9GAMM|nr:TIGR03617 family F420-dependent LLM class oxidoreductase [Pseudohalioglobus sediminis]KAA1193202.1 TIGR03617 family F420-dependent LLM class oxidoreductase [Pseudohalioglobus sediminis]